MKRVIRRPWGRKRNGGWIIQPTELLQALKDGEAVEIGTITVGAKELRHLLTGLQFPDQELLMSSNGNLEVTNIERYIAMKNGVYRTEFRKARLQHSFRVCNKAWLKDRKVATTVVIRPKKY